MMTNEIMPGLNVTATAEAGSGGEIYTVTRVGITAASMFAPAEGAFSFTLPTTTSKGLQGVVERYLHDRSQPVWFSFGRNPDVRFNKLRIAKDLLNGIKDAEDLSTYVNSDAFKALFKDAVTLQTDAFSIMPLGRLGGLIIAVGEAGGSSFVQAMKTAEQAKIRKVVSNALVRRGRF